MITNREPRLMLCLLIGLLTVVSSCKKETNGVEGNHLTDRPYFEYVNAVYGRPTQDYGGVGLVWYWSEGDKVYNEGESMQPMGHKCDYLNTGVCDCDQSLMWNFKQVCVTKVSDGSFVSRDVIFAADSVDVAYNRPTCRMIKRYRRSDGKAGNPMDAKSYSHVVADFGQDTYTYVVTNETLKGAQVEVPDNDSDGDRKEGDPVNNEWWGDDKEVVVNNTDKRVTIEYSGWFTIYERATFGRLAKRTYTITIDPHSTLTQCQYYGDAGSNDKNGVEALLANARRVSLTFDGERRVDYQIGDGKDHNLLSWMCETGDGCVRRAYEEKGWHCVYTYTITDAQYNQAEPIK